MLSKTICFFGIDDIISTIPEPTIKILTTKLEVLFACQRTQYSTVFTLAASPTDVILKENHEISIFSTMIATSERDLDDLQLDNLIMSFKGMYQESIYLFNKYYLEYGAEYSVENLVWLTNFILQKSE